MNWACLKSGSDVLKEKYRVYPNKLTSVLRFEEKNIITVYWNLANADNR